ncbi:hypothetical protein [Acinetobacter venetianus]|uniref:hypothetical protein n=1 Tax=Acinetobacter venetianus TaxID=52133 RepID=UPI0007758AFE|nr:hypothetical protein [Acinetobacter venetianus]
MNQTMIFISVILNTFFITHFLLSAFENSIWFKKKRLSRARQRVKMHVEERKELIRQLRKKHTSRKDKKQIYGFPWWPWFR